MDKRGGNTDDERHGTDLRDVLKIKLTRLGDRARGREKRSTERHQAWFVDMRLTKLDGQWSCALRWRSRMSVLVGAAWNATEGRVPPT